MKSTVYHAPFRKSVGVVRPDPRQAPLLLISADIRFHEDLRAFAHTRSRIVVRIDSPAGVAPVVQAVGPGAVLLDLDLPEHAAWPAGEALLGEPACPPLLLLSAPKDQFDLRTAMRSGSLLDKTLKPARLLESVDELLMLPSSDLAERNAIQRVLLRWLHPVGWSFPKPRAYRLSRLNE